MGAVTALAAAGLVAGLTGTAASLLTSQQRPPSIDLPEPSAALPPPPPDLPPPPLITEGAAEGERRARAAAARRQRELDRSRRNASTILTTPLGVTTPESNVQTPILGG